MAYDDKRTGFLVKQLSILTDRQAANPEGVSTRHTIVFWRLTRRMVPPHSLTAYNHYGPAQRRYVLAWSNTLEVGFCIAALKEALSKGHNFNTDQGRYQ